MLSNPGYSRTFFLGFNEGIATSKLSVPNSESNKDQTTIFFENV